MGSYKCCSLDNPQLNKLSELSALLKLVSDNSRLQILCILKNGEHCVCELTKHINLSQSLISHHLKDLKNADLVIGRKDSKWSYYCLTPKGKNIINLIFKIIK